ncbi:lipase member I-like [Anopheles funestus]|uniref:lipase member I-like n=1 Tax=Anopheles funestus TaxID=62324 RepID=UPI0020C67058|nr:lipase member I-like [Anopheles funestus]
MLDWKPYAEYGYEIAARKGVPVVANYLSQFLQYITCCCKLFPGRIGNIYALDPAGPLFSHPIDVGLPRRLARTDAKYVQVISTSRYAMGLGPFVGTQNFLPNAGYHPQAPCKAGITGLAELANALICSHQYAAELFIQTLDPANVIQGQKCDSALRLRGCLFRPKDRLGIYSKR